MIKNCEDGFNADLWLGSDGDSRTRLYFLDEWKKQPLEFYQYK
jgi:hypothetical protein